MIQHHCFSDNRAVRRRIKKEAAACRENVRGRGEGERCRGETLRTKGGRRGEETDGERTRSCDSQKDAGR